MNRVIMVATVLCCLAACQGRQDNVAEDKAAKDVAGGVVDQATVATRPAGDDDMAPASPEMVMDMGDGVIGLWGPNEVHETAWPSHFQKTGPPPKPKPTGEIRFIRLEHGGKAWNDGMTNETGRSDMNFLEKWKELGFQIGKPESIPIAALKQYKKGQAPPFVFLTGQSLTGLTTADYQTLKRYCEDGGMLFVDGAGGAFDRDFRDLMRTVFPDQPLSDIPNDDPIFRGPYDFPTGAPQLWAHGVNPRALGIRAPGSSRLCVFYYSGDLHDAWKSGHSGLSQDKAKRAMQLGINVVNYAIENYVDMYSGKRVDENVTNDEGCD